MPRALSIQRSIIPAGNRAEYFARLKSRRDYYARAKCKFWVFEEAALPGAFIEFTESADPDTLVAAHADAPEPVLDPSRIYTEVELS